MSRRLAKKRHRQSERNRIANRLLYSRARAALRNAIKAIADNSKDAEEYARQFGSFIDRAAQKGNVHRRKAARLKSRLAAKIRRITA